MSWEAVSALSTLAATIVIAGTAVFAVAQVREAQRSRRLATQIRLFDQFSSRDARLGRQYVYTKINGSGVTLSSADMMIVDEVLSSMDLAWVMVECGQLDEAFLIDTYGEMFIRTWLVLGDVVTAERGRRGSHYRRRAEELVEATKRRFDAEGRGQGLAIYPEE